jgi:hypothetical protein
MGQDSFRDRGVVVRVILNCILEKYDESTMNFKEDSVPLGY